MKLILCTRCNQKYPFTSQYFKVFKGQIEPKERHFCKKCENKMHADRKRYRYQNEPAYRKKLLQANRSNQNKEYFKNYMNDLNLKIRNKLGCGYDALHKYISRHLPKPSKCPVCNESKKLELHCKDHEYTRDINQWIYVCKKCHGKINRDITNKC